MTALYQPKNVKPDLPSYGPETLFTCEQFDRAGFETRFGEQPPAFDPNIPPKLWFISPLVGDTFNALRLSTGAAGKPAIIPYTMTAALATSVNIPGAYRYPKYVIAPTGTTMELDTNQGHLSVPIPSWRLSMEAEARQLALELGGTFEIDPGTLHPTMPVVYPPDEPRRVYQIVVGGIPRNAGDMLREKYVNGIGAPGQWVTDSIGLHWQAGQIITAPLDPNVKPIPIPCRQLDPDEEFRQLQTPVGAYWQIWKKTAVSSPADEGLRLMRLLLDRLGVTY